jgi:hypothetical protein
MMSLVLVKYSDGASVHGYTAGLSSAMKRTTYCTGQLSGTNMMRCNRLRPAPRIGPRGGELVFQPRQLDARHFVAGHHAGIERAVEIAFGDEAAGAQALLAIEIAAGFAGTRFGNRDLRPLHTQLVFEIAHGRVLERREPRTQFGAHTFELGFLLAVGLDLDLRGGELGCQFAQTPLIDLTTRALTVPSRLL